MGMINTKSRTSEGRRGMKLGRVKQVSEYVGAHCSLYLFINLKYFFKT